MNAPYPPRLLEIDDEMVALGRPVPPVVSWLSGGLKGDITTRTAAWRKQLEQWEADHPESAARWLELREQYAEVERGIEAAKWSADEWTYRTLINQGCGTRVIDTIRRTMDDRACVKKAREYLLDGTKWSLVLCGRPGSGKTSAMAWLTHQLGMRKFTPRWVRCVSMVDKPMFGFEAQLEKSKCQDAGVLALDDIGAGAREETAKAWLGWLDDVLDFRYANRRRTIMTTNMPRAKLQAWLGARLWDRIQEGEVHETTEQSMRSPTQVQEVAR